MGLTILDTVDLVASYMQYDSLFSFYENGVKDVISLAATHSGAKKKNLSLLSDYDVDIHCMNGLVGQVLREWEYAVDQALENNLVAVHRYYQLGHVKIDHDVISEIVRAIEHDVDALIKHVARTEHYQILAPESNEWLFGDDLIVNINYGVQLR